MRQEARRTRNGAYFGGVIAAGFIIGAAVEEATHLLNTELSRYTVHNAWRHFGEVFEKRAEEPSGAKPGFNRQRPEFQRRLDQLRSDDTVVVWKLDRLARSTRDLLNTMELINDAGAKFQSLSEPWANTTTHAGKMIMTVFAGIAEFERDLIRERTAAGRTAAKQRGVQFGRPRKVNPDQVELVGQLLAAGKPVRGIARTFNVHEATIYRVAATLEDRP